MSFRKAALIVVATMVATLSARAELPEWVRDVESTGALHDAMFRSVPMPSGPVETRRTPADAYAELSKSPAASAADVIAVRARLAEEKLDAAAAEADWIAFARATPDAGIGQIALANFYHRRLQPPQEADALAAAAQAPAPPEDRLRPEAQQRSWRIFERIFTLVAAQQLPDAFAEAQYRAWIARYPHQAQPYANLFRFYLDRKREADATALLAQIHTAFPDDERWQLNGRADLAMLRGADDQALAVYDEQFKPLWDESLIGSYFKLLEQTQNLRTFLDRARAGIAAHPDDLTAATRLFYYYRHAGNGAAAEQALVDFEARRTSATRTAGELLTLAQLFERAGNLDEALRYYASVYSLPGASPGDVEFALARVIETLFSAPDQRLRLGSGDLSFYRDIATLDRGPGLLNGVLSLLFNSVLPSEEYAHEESAAAAYFHRSRAADLLTLFEQRFPHSFRAPGLNATLIATYASYGESGAVIARGRRFLASFPEAPQRTSVALAMADAFARTDQFNEEIAIYDRLLDELATHADHVPVGGGDERQGDAFPIDNDPKQQQQASGAQREPEYVRVLDRYIGRLVSNKRLPDALAVYRREIERNPNDPGLYIATAQFLEQNDLGADVEQTYRLALQRFPDTSWHHRLARWYLRKKQTAAFEQLTREVTKTFAGTPLARYFSELVTPGPAISRQLSLDLNLYAHQRFPHQLTFVRNLLNAYTSKETQDAAAYDALLRRYWFEDERLEAEFFARLSSEGTLDAEIAAVRGLDAAATGDRWDRLAQTNPVATRFLGEAAIWRSQFESATPILSALAEQFPADAELERRVGSLHRSLSYADPRETDAALQALGRLQQYDPRDTATLTTLGEISADRDRVADARVPWDRLAHLEPGRADGYLESATLFWDYFQFDEALRQIANGRTALKNPMLYAYEAGAIYEGQRQYEQAVREYVQGSLGDVRTAPAHGRLLTLARRPAYRALVDRATAEAAAGEAPSMPAVSLRIEVLEALDRRADLEQFLASLVDRTTQFWMLAEIGTQAQRLGFEGVRTRALARQIERMQDPIEKLRLRYELVRLYESRGELNLARQTLETLYGEHPRVLGIVRQTVDYYWRHDLRREAIGVLTQAASASYPALRKQFTFEAVRKLNEMGDYAQARQQLQPLLAAEPFNADYLAAVADGYALAKDDGALRDFYKSTIEALRSAPLGADERTRRIAGLRRALIPALTRLHDYAGAVDQYVEIINRFPDDDGLLQEAGRYARQHARNEQLLAYYVKTAAASPKDYRWPMLVAKLETQFEDYPAAIDAYAKAIAIRPDRADFHTARARLEERLLRFDAAIESYGRTYELTYHEPQWMEKIAELRARQGRTTDAADALNKALIDGRPERAESFFAVAQRLEGWQMLDAARTFVDRGVHVASAADLLNHGVVYVRVYTRLRQAPAVFDRLMTARDDAHAAQEKATVRPADATVVATDERDGEELDDIDRALQARLNDMAAVVERDYTPEEKAKFATFLERQAEARPDDFEDLIEPLAARAGLLDLAAQWKTQLMTAAKDETQNPYLGQLVALQTSRLRFADLAKALEQFAADAGRYEIEARTQAAIAYDSGGDATGELRMLSSVPVERLSGDRRSRYFALLLARNPQQLIALAGSCPIPSICDAAANFIVAHGTADQALAAVRARGRKLPPVWTQAYLALVGLHFGRFDTSTTNAFVATLGPNTIGARLKAVDPKAQLAGDVWFDYGSLFGEYLSYAKQPGADDYLAAGIEHTPARSDAYVALAEFYLDEAHNPVVALAEYDHATVANPRRTDAHLAAAGILWQQGKRTAAIARWTRAMQLLTTQARSGRADRGEMIAVIDTLTRHGLAASQHAAIDAMVRAEIAGSGAAGADRLFRAVFRTAGGDSAAGTDWLIDVCRASTNQTAALSSLVNVTWLPDAQKDRVYERIIAWSEEDVARQHGAAQVAAQAEVARWRLRRLGALIDTKQYARADEVLRAWPDTAVDRRSAEMTTLEARLAAALHTLDALLDRYQRDENQILSLDALRNAATALRRDGDELSARQLMEFVYLRQLDREELTAPVLLGLAEIRLQRGNLPAALDLLHRLTLVVGQPFDQLSASAALLERFQHRNEALEFRRTRVQAEPWDTTAQLALAHTELAAARPAPAQAPSADPAERAPGDRKPTRPVAEASPGPETGMAEPRAAATIAQRADALQRRARIAEPGTPPAAEANPGSETGVAEPRAAATSAQPADALQRRARIAEQGTPRAAEASFGQADIAGMRADALQRLARIVESGMQPYAVRVEAARALGAAGGTLGRAPRAELDWLRAPAGMTMAAVDRPLFVSARTAYASRVADPAARAALLRAAIAVDPASDRTRIELFRSEVAAGAPRAGLVALTPLIQRSPVLRIGLSSAERSRFARELGDAYARLDTIDQALRFYRISLEGQNAATRAALKPRMDRLEAEERRQSRNRSRQPQISASLEQHSHVAPRIPPPAASPAPPAPPAPAAPAAAAKGGAQ